jgi:hypothetical protein
MSDFEDKLRALEFRAPPQDIRRRVLAATNQVRTWRDWLWPSPLAWAAVVMIWLIAFATTERPDSGAPSQVVAHNSHSPRILKAADIEHILSQQ